MNDKNLEIISRSTDLAEKIDKCIKDFFGENSPNCVEVLGAMSLIHIHIFIDNPKSENLKEQLKDIEVYCDGLKTLLKHLANNRDKREE